MADAKNSAEHRHLRRLPEDFYRGISAVHWTMATVNRDIGWLTPAFHRDFRELLFHTLSRQSLVCPVYCLMPDHMHLLLLGTDPGSDQRLAIRFLRRHASRLLSPHRLQRDAYDHVLRDDERRSDAMQAIAVYIMENPVRSGLVAEARDCPYVGCLVPGYPVLGLHGSSYWRTFWRIWTRAVTET